jgi:hypothetical protein
MFQIEIYEYSQKMSELYYNYYNIIEHASNNKNEENIDIKFMKIKTLKHPLIARYLDFIKDDSIYYII